MSRAVTYGTHVLENVLILLWKVDIFQIPLSTGKRDVCTSRLALHATGQDVGEELEQNHQKEFNQVISLEKPHLKFKCMSFIFVSPQTGNYF